jgi:prevent-host-death family protein
MSVWQMQKAKAHLGKVIEEANNKGAQLITCHGSECAVILSAADFRALSAHKPDLRDYLLGGPKVENFEVNRDRDTGRR